MALVKLAALIGALSLMGVGCRGAAFAQEITRDTRDSAGVHIITYESDQRVLEWQFRERFRLGGHTDGPEAFYRVWRTNVAVDEAGHIYVLDIPNFQLTRFDSSGRVQWAVGKRGGGPGEFEFPVRPLVRSAIEVGVYDGRRRAVIWFDSTGEHRGQEPLDVGLVRGMAVLGKALVYGRLGRPRDDGSQLVEWVITEAADTTVLTSASTAPATSQRYESCGILGISLAPVFAPPILFVGTHDAVAISAWASYVVDVFRLDGTRLSIRRALDPVKATRALARREIGEAMPLYTGPSETCMVPVEEAITKRGIAPTVPFIRELSLAPDGSIWVSRYVLPDETPISDIFSAQGDYIGTLMGHHPFPVAFLPNGDVLAIETDEWDVQRVVGYGIVKE